MRQVNPIAETLKFALPSAVEIFLCFPSADAGCRENGRRRLPEKRRAGAGRPIFMKFV
jgi:hypothetical protein